jgi:CoA:oxalate CoA-transferase
MTKPLDGVRVVDLTHVMAGPFCTFQLALLGAEVLKIERPDGGDEFRWYADRTGEGLGPSFIGVNAGKRSITLNFKSEPGRRILAQLIARADVLVENFRPGVLDKLGFAWQQNLAANPRIVQCSLTGFGSRGPLKDSPAYDHTMQAVCGLMSLTGEEGSAPMKAGFPVVDTFAGYMGAYAILAALLQRQATNAGQFIDLSMLDSSLVLMSSMILPYLIAGEEPQKVGNRGYNGSPTSDTFATADKPLAIGANTQRQFEALCRAVEAEMLIADPRFTTGDLRLANQASLRNELEGALAKRPASQWEEILMNCGVPAAAVRTIPEICSHAHVAGSDVFLQVPLPGTNRKVTILNAGFRFDRDCPGIDAAPPMLGQHTELVLADLGYSAEEIDNFKKQGVI